MNKIREFIALSVRRLRERTRHVWKLFVEFVLIAPARYVVRQLARVAVFRYPDLADESLSRRDRIGTFIRYALSDVLVWGGLLASVVALLSMNIAYLWVSLTVWSMYGYSLVAFKIIDLVNDWYNVVQEMKMRSASGRSSNISTELLMQFFLQISFAIVVAFLTFTASVTFYLILSHMSNAPTH